METNKMNTIKSLCVLVLDVVKVTSHPLYSDHDCTVWLLLIHWSEVVLNLCHLNMSVSLKCLNVT